MGEEEKFSAKKFFDFGPVAWYTVGGLGLKVIVLVLLILGGKYVLNQIFPPPANNVTSPNITVQEGATANYTVVQNSQQKRAWWVPSPFVEIYGQKDDRESGINIGTRFGARWDF